MYITNDGTVVEQGTPGVVRYELDLEARKVIYFGCLGEEYVEVYPAVQVI